MGHSKLKDGQSSFLTSDRYLNDSQFISIIDPILVRNIIYEPIFNEAPIKIYVGSLEEQMLSVKILDNSIKKRTNVKKEVFALHQSGTKYPMPKDTENRQRTLFLQRFTIAELNNFEGKALDFDSDMQVITAKKQLWNLQMDCHDILAPKAKDKSNRLPQFSVIL